MGVSKEAMLDAFGRFKELQDEANTDKFVAKEAGKSLISDADLAKLNGIDTAGYVPHAQVQTALSALNSIFGVAYTPESPGDNPGGDTGTSGGGISYIGEPDEVITDEELQELFH